MSKNTLVLIKDGKEIDINDHPSLLAAFHANHRAIERVNDEIKLREEEVDELTERLKLHEDMGLPTQGIKSVRTRRKNQIANLKQRRKAYQKNYLEVPNMDGRTIEDETFWGARLDTSVPLDALRAMKHAKEQGIFSEFELCEPRQERTDPMIAGVAGGRRFYIASWT